MARTVDLGVTTYWWVPGNSGIANINAITVAELTAPAAVNISRFVLSTSTAGPVASDIVSERSVADTSNVDTPTIGNYEGNLVCFRDLDEEGLPTEDDVAALFEDRAVGFLVKRVGKPSTDAAAAADLIAFAGKYICDEIMISGGAGDGMLKVTTPMLKQGVYAVNKPVVATAP